MRRGSSFSIFFLKKIQEEDFNFKEFLEKVKSVGKGDEVNSIPTNISLHVLSKSVLPITNNLGTNADEVKVSPIISEPKTTFSALPITSNSVLPITCKLPNTNNNIGENADGKED